MSTKKESRFSIFSFIAVEYLVKKLFPIALLWGGVTILFKFLPLTVTAVAEQTIKPISIFLFFDIRLIVSVGLGTVLSMICLWGLAYIFSYRDIEFAHKYIRDIAMEFVGACINLGCIGIFASLFFEENVNAKKTGYALIFLSFLIFFVISKNERQKIVEAPGSGNKDENSNPGEQKSH